MNDWWGLVARAVQRGLTSPERLRRTLEIPGQLETQGLLMGDQTGLERSQAKQCVGGISARVHVVTMRTRRSDFPQPEESVDAASGVRRPVDNVTAHRVNNSTGTTPGMSDHLVRPAGRAGGAGHDEDRDNL